MSTPRNSHDAFFTAFISSKDAGDTLARDMLPRNIVAQLSDEPVRWLSSSFDDDNAFGSVSDQLLEGRLRDGRPFLIHVLLTHRPMPDESTLQARLRVCIERVREYYGQLEGNDPEARPQVFPLLIKF